MSFAKIPVTPGQSFYISIGTGANMTTGSGNTSFGGVLIAQGGSGTKTYYGGSGGSGGGGGNAAAFNLTSGNGGSAGSSGQNSTLNRPGGSGQGTDFTAYFSQFRLNNISAGMGAAGVNGFTNYHLGGGGGGGVLVNGAGPNSTGGQCCPGTTYCGPGPASGYGAGGSGGCWSSGFNAGGAGASGLVYIEFFY